MEGVLPAEGDAMYQFLLPGSEGEGRRPGFPAGVAEDEAHSQGPRAGQDFGSHWREAARERPPGCAGAVHG